LSKRSGNSLIVKIKASVAVATVVSVIHVGAGLLLFVIAVPTAVRLALLAALILSLAHTLRQHAFRRRPGAIVALRLNDDGELSIRHDEQEPWSAAAIHSRFVHRWLVLLSLRVAGRRLPTTLVVAADAIEADVFRRLRAALLAPPRNPAA
jgi:hypothetical protein